MPTFRQKRAFEKTIETQGNVSKAMLEAGYSKSHAHNPQSLTNSKGFKEMLDKLVPEKALIKKVQEMLSHGDLVHKDFPADLGITAIEAIFKKAKIEILYIKQNTSKKPYITVYYMQPDAITQDKALDKLFRLHGSYEAEKLDHSLKGGFSLSDLFEKTMEKRRERERKTRSSPENRP